jgi:hypothetical protein
MHRGKSVLSRILQHGKDLLAFHGWKPFEEILDRVTAFEVVEETPHRNTRPGKDKFPAKNTRILRNDTGHHKHHNSVGLLMQLRPCGNDERRTQNAEVRALCAASPVVSRPCGLLLCRSADSVRAGGEVSIIHRIIPREDLVLGDAEAGGQRAVIQ